MNELVFIQKDDIFTNTMIIAQYSGNEHESVVAMLKKYLADFEESGKIEFTDLKSGNPKGGRPTRIYILNEEQAMLLVTYLDNTVEVRRFKKNLVRQFISMRRLLLERQTADWQQARIESKSVRLQETDAIKELVEYAKIQGSTHSDRLYMNYSKLVKQLATYDTRDAASTETLTAIILLERIMTNIIMQEMAMNTHYKMIYQKAKIQLAELMRLWTLPRLTA